MNSKKPLWNTIKISLPSEFISVSKTGKITIKQPLTKSKTISKLNKIPAVQLVEGDKLEILNDGSYEDYNEYKKNNINLLKDSKDKLKLEKEENNKKMVINIVRTFQKKVLSISDDEDVPIIKMKFNGFSKSAKELYKSKYPEQYNKYFSKIKI